MEIPLWLKVLESLAAVATPILITIGGVFAWYRFFRQSEHVPRLQPTVSSEISIKENRAYIVATVNIENPGLVDVKIDREATGLLLYARKANSNWREPEIAYNVFPGQNAVQPNAALEDKIWIERDLEDEVALCLELAVEGKEGLAWRTKDIISLLDGGHLSAGG